MAQSIGAAWRSFWHTMTSSDRHASHNSPYRTGQHVPLPQSRHSTLTSVATDAAESRTDLNGLNSADAGIKSPHVSQAPYTPGSRTSMQRSQSDESTSQVRTGEIQMQSFSDGLPPPPPITHSWKRIDGWVEAHYEELHDNLAEGCTQNDINELEHELDCTLPMDVRESLQVHDGQERGGLPTGIIFGCMLLDCEEIVQEWNNWRRVNEDYFSNHAIQVQSPAMPVKAFAGASSSSAAAPPNANPAPNSMWRDELQARQDSQPPHAIQKTYAHTSWIPLARDWGGNCLAVDLAPGASGRWGQVIIMGRDYDCKYVVARSWAAFLANVADDMSSPKVFVNEETGELKLREFKQPGVEPAYLNILRWRVDQKYGRKAPRRPPMNGDIRINSNVGGSHHRISPYGSPVAADGERGSSPQRFPSKGISGGSPRISSPLARVAEESPTAIDVPSELNGLRKGSLANVESVDNLISPDTPIEEKEATKMPVVDNDAQAGQAEDKGKESQAHLNGSDLEKKTADVHEGVNGVDEMKTVEL